MTTTASTMCLTSNFKFLKLLNLLKGIFIKEVLTRMSSELNRYLYKKAVSVYKPQAVFTQFSH